MSFLDRSCSITDFTANQEMFGSHLSVLTQMKYICNYLVCFFIVSSDNAMITVGALNYIKHVYNAE